MFSVYNYSIVHSSDSTIIFAIFCFYCPQFLVYCDFVCEIIFFGTVSMGMIGVFLQRFEFPLVRCLVILLTQYPFILNSQIKASWASQ